MEQLTLEQDVAPLAAVVDQAVGTDPEIDRLRQTMADNRLFGARYMAQLLGEKATRRGAVTADEAADVFFLFKDPAVYRTLVHDRAWRRDRFTAWLAVTYRYLLLQ